MNCCCFSHFFSNEVRLSNLLCSHWFQHLSMLLPVSLYLLCQASMISNEDGSLDLVKLFLRPKDVHS